MSMVLFDSNGAEELLIVDVFEPISQTFYEMKAMGEEQVDKLFPVLAGERRLNSRHEFLQF